MAALGATVMLLLSVDAFIAGDAPAAAADGSQGPLSLVPGTIPTATDVFSLRPPEGAHCEEDGSGSGPAVEPGPKTGADNWRWHSFIVEAGRDLSSLRFGSYGPGEDFDATDGEITAPLIAAGGNVVIEKLPALRPEGMINPDELAGLNLDPAIYTLPDGDYVLGLACTDGPLDTRQWWSVEVTVRSSGGPFLTGPTADQGTTAAPVSPSDGGDGARPAEGSATGSEPSSPGELAAEATNTAGAATDAARPTTENPGSSAGVSWSPLTSLIDASSLLPMGGWALLAVVLARISYLLARPTSVLPIPAA